MITDILSQEWNNERLGDIQDALQALLNQMVTDINGAKDKKVADINLFTEGTDLTVTITFSDDTEATATVDIQDALSAADIAVDIVNNLRTDNPSKALSASMGMELNRKACVLLEHMHLSADTMLTESDLELNEQRLFFVPTLNRIYAFDCHAIGSGLVNRDVTRDVYPPRFGIVYFDKETNTCWRWDGTNMVLTETPPYYVVKESTNDSTIADYMPAVSAGEVLDRLVWFSELGKLVWLYMDGQTRRSIQFGPDKRASYTWLGQNPKIRRWNGSAWVDVIDISSKANASEVVPNTRKVNNKPLSSDVTIGMSDIQGLGEALEDIEAGTTVVINSDGANIVNEQSDSILTAPSSRMVKEIYLNLRALFDPTNGLAGIAFLGTKPTWQTVDIPEHTITLNLTDATATFNNESVSGSFDADEGEITIKLTPAQDKMILANNISIMLGNENVPFTLATDNGSVLVTFILAGDVTFTAAASSGIGVQVSGNNVSANVNGIALSGGNRTIILSHPDHFDWNGSIALSVNSVALVVNTDYTITDNQDGTKTITILKTFTSDAYPIVIAANAVEADFAAVTFGTLTNVVIKRGNTELNSGGHVYEGDTISILPVGNNKVSATVTIGSTAATLQGDTYNGFTYTIQQGDVSSSGTSIAIAATATEVQNYGVTLPTGNNFTAALQDASGNPLSSPVREGSTIKIAFTPDTDYGISISSVAMGSSSLDTDSSKSSYYTFSNNILTIVNVQGVISVSASAAEVGKVNVTYNLRNMVVSSDNATDGKIEEGGTFEAMLDTAPTTVSFSSGSPTELTIAAKRTGGGWSTPSVVVKMNGIDITETAYDSTTKEINVSNVDGNIEITAITEPQMFRTAQAYRAGDGKYTAIAITDDRNFCTNSLYFVYRMASGGKLRWFHAAQKSNNFYNAYNLNVFVPSTSGSVNTWDTTYAASGSPVAIGGSGGSKFPYNYTDSGTIGRGRIFMNAGFAQNHLSSCFIVDITDVDADALAAADQAAVDAYNSANSTSYTTASRVVCASLDDIVALGGKVIFDGRYAELINLPS